MNEVILKELLQISEEERKYLGGQKEVEKALYTEKKDFEIDSKKLLAENRLVTVRRHSRFVDFPVHRHNYVEIMYVCQGRIVHDIDGKELVMVEGELLLLNREIRHGVRRVGEQDIGVNFITLPEFFDIPLGMLGERNVLADFIGGIFKSKEPAAHYLLFQVGDDMVMQNLLENMIWTLLFEEENQNVILQYTMGLLFLRLLQNMDSLRENSFQELLQRKRFQKAVVLILETELSVEEIIYQVGYENDSYFYRKFREKYGMTPKKYRKEYAGQKAIRL